MKRFALVVWIALFAASCRATGQLPEFELAKVTGGTLKSSDLKGKVVIVDFWATWCLPCKVEVPNFNALADSMADRGVAVVGITLESGSLEDVAPFIEELDIKYPIVMGTDEVQRGFGGVFGFPTTFVVDQDWRVHKKYFGALANKKELLEQDIAYLLGEGP